MTIMFTDIEGSTTYFESRGDINGLSMVFKHNELLFPVIERHQGTVIKTIGDSIMASFPNAVEGVRAAIEMQKTLSSYNTTHPKQDQIRIRIGLNAGKGIVEQQDVFGDLVNVAARIESLAEPGQILVSQTVYEAMRKTDDSICKYYDCTELKGKEEPIELYQVIWGGEEITTESKSAANSTGLERRKHYLRKGIPLGIGAVLLIIFLLLVVERDTLWRREVGNNLYHLAYQQLREGKIEEAQKEFNQMKPDDALYFEGLAAVYFQTGEHEKSLVMCERALKVDQKNLYSHVIRGNIFLGQGNIGEAAIEYEKATQLTRSPNWQRAEAYNNLGRLYAAQNRVEEAFSLYDQAVLCNPDASETYANQGILFERVGNLSQAIPLYQRALEVKPQDPIAKVLLEEAARKKELSEDRERTQRIDSLVTQLIKAYQEKKETNSGTDEDEWTSTPKMAVLGYDFKGRNLQVNL